MKVLHSVDTYLLFTENWIEPQVYRVPGVGGRVLCGARANSDVFTPPASEIIVDSRCRVWPEPIQRRIDAIARRRGFYRLRSELKVRRWKPDVVHAHFGPRAWRSRALARRLQVPLVSSFYGYDAWLLPQGEPVWKQRYLDLFTASSTVVVEGPSMRDRLLWLRCPAEKIVVHRIGADLESLPYTPRDFSEGINLVMVGRFVEKKGLADGLRACALARSRGMDLRVTIVGDATDNDSAGQRIKQELETLAASKELAGAVRFPGFVSVRETAAIMRAQQVMLCPSRHAANGDAEGGSPVVLTEAMASGLLCIGTRHCDIPEVIVNGETGALCDEGDVEVMAELIRSVNQDPERSARMTLAGRSRMESMFSLETQLGRMHDVYLSAIGAGRPPQAEQVELPAS